MIKGYAVKDKNKIISHEAREKGKKIISDSKSIRIEVVS